MNAAVVGAWLSVGVLIVVSGSGGSGLLDPTNSILVTEPKPQPSSRKHKVHNLVLNPDKHSWCELKPIRQIVTQATCVSKEMENFVCVGTCFSYTVPQTEPETPGDELLDYCDSCTASESHWTTVTLDCEDDVSQYTITKNIQMITNCSCSACKPSYRGQVNKNGATVYHSKHRISDIIHKMLPDSQAQKFKDPLEAEVISIKSLDDDDDNDEINMIGNGGNEIDMNNKLRYATTQIDKKSLGDLKKQFNLNDKQEKLLHDKVLIKDTASFMDDDILGRGYISN